MTENRQTADVKRGASIDELARRMVSIENTDDDLARMIANNWQNIVWGVVLLGVAIVVFREFQVTQQKKAGEIAQRFTEVQTDIRKAFDTRAPSEPSPAIQENLKLLTTSYSDEIYGRLARIYQAALHRKDKKFEEARSDLSVFAVNSLYAHGSPVRVEALAKNDPLVELAALQLLRVSLDEGKASAAEIRKQLIGLSYGSRFVTGEALLALFRLSRSAEEKAEAEKVAKAVLDSRGALRGKLAEQLSAEGILIDGGAMLVQSGAIPMDAGPISVAEGDSETPEGDFGDNVSN